MKLLELSFQDWILKYKIKNIILKLITAIFVMTLLLGMCMANSESNIPFFMIIISMCWLVLYGIVNDVIQL